MFFGSGIHVRDATANNVGRERKSEIQDGGHLNRKYLYHSLQPAGQISMKFQLVTPCSLGRAFMWYNCVQNSLARVVVPSCKKYDHIQPVLQELHWLPVGKRTEFKLATLTFKVLENKQPMYLYELLHRHVPVRSLRSEGKNLLVVPNIKSANGRRSFFCCPNDLELTSRTHSQFLFFNYFQKTTQNSSFPPLKLLVQLMTDSLDFCLD